MKFGIVADSCCDYNLSDIQSENFVFEKIPFTISAAGKDYVDDENIDIQEMMKAAESDVAGSKTACASPGEWYNAFEKYDCVFAVTISKNLSGSYNSAEAARDMILDEYPDKKIHIIDSRGTGPKNCLIVKKCAELIDKGLEYDEIVKEVDDFENHTQTLFTLSTFNNLVKAGRMSKVSGLIAGRLNLWGIGIASTEGTVITKGKAMGVKSSISKVLPIFDELEFQGGEVLISHVDIEDVANLFKDELEKKYPNTNVTVIPTGGLCSYYAERHGIVFAFTTTKEV